uniref:Uncharacterized protein n=1 Tax=Romanomermis culicivorax TaxID=13658 RepID=A0A915KTX6_ROMCU
MQEDIFDDVFGQIVETARRRIMSNADFVGNLILWLHLQLVKNVRQVPISASQAENEGTFLAFKVAVTYFNSDNVYIMVITAPLAFCTTQTVLTPVSGFEKFSGASCWKVSDPKNNNMLGCMPLKSIKNQP